MEEGGDAFDANQQILTRKKPLRDLRGFTALQGFEP